VIKFGRKLGGGKDNPTPVQQKVIDLPNRPITPNTKPPEPGTDVKLPQTLEDGVIGVERFAHGFVMQGLSTVHGLSKFITEPEKIIDGLKHMAKDPGGTGKHLWKSIEDSWNKDPVEFAGRATFEVASLFLGPGGKGGTAGKAASKLDDVAKLATKADDLAKAATKADDLAKAATKADDLAKAATKADDLAKAATKTAGKADDVAKAATKADEAVKVFETRAAAADHAIAKEMTTAVKDGKPLIAGAEQQAKAEAVLGRELGDMRKAVDGGKAADVEKLSVALQKEAGLGKEAADTLAKNAHRDAIERSAAAALAEKQSVAGKPLTHAELKQATQEIAEKAGLPAKEAKELAEQLAEKAGFRDWVASQLSPQKWSPDLAREHFLGTTSPTAAKQVEKLTAAELRALYPEGGAIPSKLRAVAEVDGFGAFAKTHPNEARLLADANGVFDGVPLAMNHAIAEELQIATRAAPGGKLTPALEEAARVRAIEKVTKEFEEIMPAVKQHPTDPRYMVVERKPGSPSWMPEVNLRPTKELDHNGAFQQSALVKGRTGTGTRWVDTAIPDYRLMRPEQLQIGGKPLANMDGVMVFSGHGGRGGFDIATKDAAKMAADEILTAQKQGKTIDKLVLDACHQRDKKWFMGGSNAQAFEVELNKELAKAGGPKVTVLAASRGGPTYGSTQKAWMPTVHRSDATGKLTFGSKFADAAYTPAADGARFYMTKSEAAVAGLLGAEVVVGGGYLTYRALTDK
jgi:hypothetical protein